jgi:lipopolysaccharide transport system ATP-binding protein
VPETLISIERAGKKFCRSLSTASLYGVSDMLRGLLRRGPRQELRRGEFWALQDVSFSLARGECLGVIGPNGAGKTTLLKLINGEHRPDSGAVARYGALTSLIRIGSGLHPMFTGRENIYMQCAQLGLATAEIDRRLDEIVAFAELESAIDRPVRTYSDGMYSRLEFSITTAVPTDILLVDEVLAVGDVAFQMRCLQRINGLKANGTAIVFVSHSEMNIRQVSDRCLLLLDGRQIAQGPTDPLFYKYYESIGYLNRKLEPLGVSHPLPADLAGDLAIDGLQRIGNSAAGGSVPMGQLLELKLAYRSRRRLEAVTLSLEFRNRAKILVASIDSGVMGRQFVVGPGAGEIRIAVPFVSLTPGLYGVSVALRDQGGLLAHRGDALELAVVQSRQDRYHGLSVIPAQFEQV